MPMDWKTIGSSVVSSVIGTVVVAGLAAAWNWGTGGGLIEALKGATAKEVDSKIAALKAEIDGRGGHPRSGEWKILDGKEMRKGFDTKCQYRFRLIELPDFPGIKKEHYADRVFYPSSINVSDITAIFIEESGVVHITVNATDSLLAQVRLGTDKNRPLKSAVEQRCT